MDLESMKKVWEAYLEVTEKKLSPKQKKIDHDGDGDIEGDDLAALRAKKGQKNESSCGKDRVKKENDNGDDDKEECPKCKGKGCDHCDDKGYHMKEEAPADPIKGAPARRGDKKNGDKSMANDYPELTREFVDVLEKAGYPPNKPNSGPGPDKKHVKGATKPEGIMDKESPKSKKFADDHNMGGDTTSPESDFDEKGHDDVSKAGRAVKSQASSRRGDNLGNGDSKSPEKVKDNS